MAEQREEQTLSAVMEEALSWHLRLSSGHAGEEAWAEHAEWLAADPAHLDAFSEVDETFGRVDAAASAVAARYRLPQAGTGAPRRRLMPLLAIFGSRPALAAGLVAALMVLFIGGGLLYRQQAAPQMLEFATAIGEVRHVALPDGSVVDLDTDTVLKVAYSDHLRDTQLLHGRAVFDVEHNPDRPFLVRTQGHEVRVLGTRFEVASRDTGMSVAVVRGLVGVSSAATAGAAPLARLTPGEKLDLPPSGAPRHETVDPETIGTWTEHRLTFDETPLSRVLQEINRYFPGKALRIEDAVLGDIAFTGSLYIDDAEKVARNLASFTGLHYEREGGGFILSRKPDGTVN
jgi:transmembrane sensor